MPKKTKKQKIKNKEHRQKQQYIPQIPPESSHEQQLPDPKLPIFSFTGTSTAKIPKEDKTMYSYNLSDLRKTTILAILSIGILIALSIVLN